MGDNPFIFLVIIEGIPILGAHTNPFVLLTTIAYLIALKHVLPVCLLCY